MQGLSILHEIKFLLKKCTADVQSLDCDGIKIDKSNKGYKNYIAIFRLLMGNAFFEDFTSANQQLLSYTTLHDIRPHAKGFLYGEHIIYFQFRQYHTPTFRDSSHYKADNSLP